MPLIAVLLTFLLVSLVFSVDVAYMQLARTELRAAVDASAKAGAEALTRLQDPALAIDAAVAAAAQNEVSGVPLVLDPANVILGRSTEQDDGTWKFEAGATPYTSVRVKGVKSDGSAAGAVPLFFSKILGSSSFSPEQSATASQFQHEIVLCIDRSHSMTFDLTGVDWSYPSEVSFDEYCKAPGATGSRWASLESAVDAFVYGISSGALAQQQKVGVVTWSTEGRYRACGNNYNISAATVELPLGNNFAAINSAIQARGNQIMLGGTNMTEGLKSAIDLVIGTGSNPSAEKTIILFTDGQWNQGGNPIGQANRAKAKSIKIHPVTFMDGVDLADMTAIATATGGTHYHAKTTEELKATFLELARNLPLALTE